jgi:beta-galactosidase
LAGSRCEASIAIVSDYDNEWDGELDRWFGPLAARSMRAWFKTLQREHVAVDRLVMTERTTLNDLKRYRVLVYPHPAILTETMADLLREYVEAGGILLFGARTGYKDEHGQCRMMPLPGYATALSGVRVEDFTAVSNDADSPNLRWLANETDDLATTTDLRAMAFNDILRVESDRVQIIAEYASDYYAGKPALTVHTVGEGQVYYYGAVYTEAVVRKLLPRLGLQRIASDLVQAPAEVELVVRRHPASGETFIFALNYTNRPAQLRMLRPAVDLLTDRSLSTDVALEPYGVLVLV